MDCQTNVDWTYVDTQPSEMINSNSAITCLCPHVACTIYPLQRKSVRKMCMLLNLGFSRRWILSSGTWRREMSLVEVRWRFAGMWCLHLQVRRCAKQRARTWKHFHSHRCENLKSNTAEFLWQRLHYLPTINAKFHGNPFSSQYGDNMLTDRWTKAS